MLATVFLYLLDYNIISYICKKNDMSAPKNFKIKQSESELKKLMKKSHPMIAKRIQALLIFKRNEAYLKMHVSFFAIFFQQDLTLASMVE